MKTFVISVLLSLSCFAANSQQFDVDTIQYNGGTDELINVVFLGDGYTQDQLDRFAGDARDASKAFFAEPPFSNYQNYFNVFLIRVPSNDSGAADDPSQLIDNYFGSTYNAYYGIQRLLAPMRIANITNVLANNFPVYDQVLMIVNDARYGGSGGWVATFSTHISSLEIFLHELGHSFSALADEYWAGDQYAQEAINMTKETNIGALKRKNWYGDQGIGLYPHSESPTWYRPHQSCKMRVLGPAYCSVCGEGIIERIHALVPPLISYSPASALVTPVAYPLSFKLNLIKPIPNTLHVEWRLNNSRLESNGDSIGIYSFDLVMGTNSLRALIEDSTALIRVDKHNTIHFSVVDWTIETTVTGIEALVSSRKIHVSIFPNPFHDYITIEFKDQLNDRLNVDIVDMMGNRILSDSFEAPRICTLHTANLNAGYYLLNVSTDDIMLASYKMVKK